MRRSLLVAFAWFPRTLVSIAVSSCAIACLPSVPNAGCATYGDYLHMLGGCEPVGYARGMVYQAPYLYLADYERALRVVDAADPARLTVVGSLVLPAVPMGLDVSGTVGCVALYSRVLQMIDVSNPEAPVPLGSAEVPSGPRDVAMAGGYAYVPATQYPGEEGLYVFDIHDPAAPRLVNRVEAGELPRKVIIDGGEAYVLAVDRLIIFDISDPEAPSWIGSVTIPGQPAELVCRGSYVYVVCRMSDEAGSDFRPAVTQQRRLAGAEGRSRRSWGNGFYVIDRSDLSNPTLIGSFAPEEWAPFLGIGLWGDYAIVSRDAALMLMNITEPTAPRLELEIGVQRFAEEFEVVDDVLFAWGDRLMSYLLREPFSPEPVAVVQGTEDCGVMTVRGSNAFAAESWGRNFHSIDLTVPEEPVVSTIQLPFESVVSLAATEAKDKAAYVYASGSGNPDTTAIIEVSDPRDPRVVGVMHFAHRPSDLKIEGARLYAIEGAAGVRIFDIADPLHPLLLNTIPFTYTPQELALRGTTLYVGQRIEWQDHLYIYDVADPIHPVQLGTSTIPLTPYAFEIDGDLLYVADGEHGVRILDVSDPASVSLVSEIAAIGRAHDICRQGSFLYVTDFRTWGGMHVIDVSDPARPSMIGRFHADSPYQVECLSGHLFVSSFRAPAVVAPLECSASGLRTAAAAPGAALLSISPNSAAGPLEIRMDLPRTTPLSLTLHDAAGRLVRVLDQGMARSGVYVRHWDGLDGQGRQTAAGVYFVRLQSGSMVQARTLVRTR